MHALSKASKTIKFIWAAPCSAVGVVFGTIVMLCGGSAKRSRDTLEFTFRDSEALCGKLAKSLRFRAITFGHVIIAVTAQELAQSRDHELVHVRQYERWGAAFFVAYPASSLWQWLMGRKAYWNNCFEIQARALSPEPSGELRVKQPDKNTFCD